MQSLENLARFCWGCIVIVLKSSFEKISMFRVLSFLMFYFQVKSLSLEIKWIFKHQVLQIFRIKLSKILLVGRGSHTQLQAGEYFN